MLLQYAGDSSRVILILSSPIRLMYSFYFFFLFNTQSSVALRILIFSFFSVRKKDIKNITKM